MNPDAPAVRAAYGRGVGSVPVLLSCRGGSPLSQATERVAAALERSGRVRRGEPAPGDDVVVLDGCASACTARRLAAEGRTPRAALLLDELGGLEEAAGTGLPRRPRERAAAAAAHTAGDYLLALDALTGPVADCGSLVSGTPTLASHVSAFLGVSRQSAGEMLARLERDGLVARGPRKELLLSEAGRAAADRAVRRHRVLEVFVATFLRYPAEECWEHARALDPAFDDDAVEHLRIALGEPERCPHGWPVDAALARAEAAELTTLAALPAGTTATVVRVAETAAPAAPPGARVTAGTLDERQAAWLLVRP